ncbi:hypothetical protein FRB99_000649 [Tulasnella sp. 403]|nr:hypothetical protein FRB99_000649 [Tulasnella sp. 403]
MATLAPQQLSTRARSSSTAGNFTTARSRAVSTSLPSDKAQDQSSPSPSHPPNTMFGLLFTVAARVVPIHDALAAISPKRTDKHADLNLDLAIGSLSTSTSWDSEKIAFVVSDADSTTSSRGSLSSGYRTRPSSPTKKHKSHHRRNISPFSSLFITPPSATLPPPVSSPRSSISLSRFTPLSIAIPSPATALPLFSSRLLIPLLLVCSLFFLTLLPVVFTVWTLPIQSLKHFPRTLSDIRQLAKELQVYASSGFAGRAHIFAVLAVTSIWKNAWSVPGSALLNVLAGALMNPILATFLQTALTTVGSICSTLLSKPLTPVISHVFPRALSLTKSAFEGSPVSSPQLSPLEADLDSEKLASAPRTRVQKTPIWVRLTVLRLVGVVPWSALNLACGISDVPLWDCAVGGFIGVLPWTAVTCQIGDILQTVASTSSASSDAPVETLSSVLTSPSIIAKLIFLSLLSLGPVLLRDRLSDLISRRRHPQTESSTEESEKLIQSP